MDGWQLFTTGFDVGVSLRQRCPELIELDSPPPPSWSSGRAPESSETMTARWNPEREDNDA